MARSPFDFSGRVALVTGSTETARNHVRRVFSELQMHTRLEAIAAARRLGLLAPPVLGPQRSNSNADTK
jgi:hypothetical protein